MNKTEPDIFNLIIETMGIAQKQKVTNKKEFVMNVLRKSMEDETYERYEPYISVTIDMLKVISRDANVLKCLRSKKCLSCVNIR